MEKKGASLALGAAWVFPWWMACTALAEPAFCSAPSAWGQGAVLPAEKRTGTAKLAQCMARSLSG
jgi:hypothetical protein